jgi:hypothetical protein
MNIATRLKKIDEILDHKRLPIFPILGGVGPDEPTRDVTPEEREILRTKGLPIPVSISLKREQEFQKLLRDELQKDIR